MILLLKFSMWHNSVKSVDGVTILILCTSPYCVLYFYQVLKGYCTCFQHALKSLEIISIILSSIMSKTARKNSKGLKSYKEFKF